MRRFLFILTAILSLALTGCFSSSGVGGDSDRTYDLNKLIPDPVLRKEVIWYFDGKTILSEDDVLRCLFLDVTNIEIKTHKGIEIFRNLETLEVARLKDEDIRLIGSLSKIDNLKIYDLSIVKDISPLSKLTNLKYFEFYSYYGKDLNFVKPLTKLQKLYIHDSRLEDISGISTLTELREIDICVSKIKDISPIVNLKYLKWIQFSYSDITDISIIPQFLENKIWEKVFMEDYLHCVQISFYDSPLSDASKVLAEEINKKYPTIPINTPKEERDKAKIVYIVY